MKISGKILLILLLFTFIPNGQAQDQNAKIQEVEAELKRTKEWHDNDIRRGL